MAEQITLTSLSNLQALPTSAVSAIDANNATITEAFLDVLSLSGTAPNQMQSNLDMNGFQILNQGADSFTVATLPASPTLGQMAVVTDGTSGLAWGATVTGGSSTKYLVWYDGSVWSVLGK